jgi:hypothetical protein
MERMGRLLVLFIFAASVGFLALAVAVYTNRLEWVTRTPGEGREKITGQVEKLNNKLKEYAEARDRADDRWAAGERALRAAERERPVAKAWYLVQLKNLRGDEGDGVIRPLPIDPQTGQVSRTIQGDPLSYSGAPAVPLAAYRTAIATRLAEMKKEQETLQGLSDEKKALTIQINGPEEELKRGGGGLRRQVAIQVEAAKRAREEQEHLKPALANRYAEAVLLLKRQAALEARIEELEKAARAATRLP